MEPQVPDRARSGRPAVAPEALAPAVRLLGRSEEERSLGEAIAASRPVVIVGEAGIGKSALMAAAVAGRPARFGGALGMLAAVPCLALHRAVGGVVDGDAATVAQNVLRRVPDGGVLVLDDLHWADDTTVDVIRRLCGLLPLLMGVRSGGARADAVVAALAASGATVLPLGPLPIGDAAALAIRDHSSLGPAAARRLATASGGNPLLVQELARSGEVTTSLRLAILHRLGGLGPERRSLVELLAVAGTPLPLERLGADAAMVPSLAGSGFLQSSDGIVGIRHALIADVVAAALGPARRAGVHRRAASLVDDPLLKARHLAGAGARHAAVVVASAAAGDPGLPAGHRAAALAVAAENEAGPDAGGLRLDAAEALAAAAQFREAGRLLDLVPGNDAPHRARSLRIRASVLWGLGDGPGSLAAAEAALAASDPADTRLRAGIQLELAWTVTLMRDGPRAVPLARDALAAHLALGLPPGPARRVLATAMSITQVAIDEWGPLLRGAIDEAHSRGDLAEELLCAKILAASEQVAGNPAAGRVLGEALADRARAGGMLGWEQSLRSTLLSIAVSQADYAKAITDGDALLDEPLEPRTRAQAAGSLAMALLDTGRLDDALAVLAPALATAPDDPDGRFDLLHARVEHALADGDPARALALADAALASYGEASYGDVRSLRVARDWAALEAGLPAGAAVPDEPVHPFWAGAAPEREGIRALARDRPADAARLFALASARYARYLRRAEIRCRWAEGGALRRAGRIAEAIRVLEAAEATAEGLGMVPLVARIRREIRLTGTRRSVARGRRGRLSAREREVLDLVATGLTNAQIAARLGVGRPTVARLIANAGDKLGTTSRLQAAVERDRGPA